MSHTSYHHEYLQLLFQQTEELSICPYYNSCAVYTQIPSPLSLRILILHQYQFLRLVDGSFSCLTCAILGHAAFNMELSIDADVSSTSFSETNRFPIVLIICEIGKFANLLSIVLLSGILSNLQTLSNLSLLHLIDKK